MIMTPEKFFDSLNPETTDSLKDSVIAWALAIFGILMIVIVIGFFKEHARL